MKHGMVSSAKMMQYHRWDAGFHLAVQEVETRAEQLCARFQRPEDKDPDDVVRKLLASFTDVEKAPILVLGRGKHPKVEVVEKEYPYLALAIMERELGSLVGNAEKALQTEADRVRAMKEIVETLSKTK